MFKIPVKIGEPSWSPTFPLLSERKNLFEFGFAWHEEFARLAQYELWSLCDQVVRANVRLYKPKPIALYGFERRGSGKWKSFRLVPIGPDTIYMRDCMMPPPQLLKAAKAIPLHELLRASARIVWQ
jgi:hypothetical protein